MGMSDQAKKTKMVRQSCALERVVAWGGEWLLGVGPLHGRWGCFGIR